jgi:integral membrane protein
MKYLRTKIGRLRLIAFLEGISLLALIGIAVPMKYAGNDPSLVRSMGPIHGLLFLLFIINTISVGIEYKWQFKETTWKVLVACIIPFGTFYIDRKILRKMNSNQ